MARFFSGFRSGSGSGGKKASAIFLSNLNKKGGGEKPSADEQYKRMFEEKMAAQKQGMGAGKSFGFVPPGTKGGERKLSKSAETLLQQMAEKKVKQDLKRERKKADRRHMEQKRQQRTEEIKKQQASAMDAKKRAEATAAFWNSASSGGNAWGSSDKKDSGWW